MKITSDKIDALREHIKGKLSEKRCYHTLCVEKMAVRIARIYCPEKEDVLRVSALLHDITKEYPKEKQLEIFKKHGEALAREEISASSTWHARTAALVIPEEYKEYALPEVINAVRYHTTGREGMSKCEKIIYLADYIDESRTYDDCVALRREFFAPCFEEMSEGEKMLHLNKVILHSFDITMTDLIKRGKTINRDTISSRNGVIFEIEEAENSVKATAH